MTRQASATTPEARLKELDILLPEAAAPAANYVPYLLHNGLLYISGQLPMGVGGLEFEGKIGGKFDVEEGQQAARLCGLNILAQARKALGSLDNIERCIRLAGFVNAGAGFRHHPAIVNGASDLMVEVLGERGRHVRIAVGADNLPFDAPVEIEALFAVA